MRSARASDDAQMRALFAATTAAAAAAAWSAYDPERLASEYEQWRSGLPEESVEVVALVRGEVVGHLVMHAGERITQVLALRVRPSLRGRGIARALLAPVLSSARRSGREVEIRVPADAGLALAASRSLGFTPYATDGAYVRVRAAERPDDSGPAR